MSKAVSASGDKSVPWVRSQIKAFVAWTNYVLKPKNLYVNASKIESEFSDGTILLELLAILRRKPAPAYNKKPTRNKFERVENLEKVLKTMESDRIPTTGLDAHTLEDSSKNLKLTLGLLWQLVVQFYLKKGFHEEEKGQGGESAASINAKNVLLRWCQDVVERHDDPHTTVRDFTTSWKSGVNFAKLFDDLFPGYIDVPKMDQKDEANNLSNVFRMAEQHLGIPQLLDADAMAKGELDSQSIMTYLTFFRLKDLEYIEDADDNDADAAPSHAGVVPQIQGIEKAPEQVVEGDGTNLEISVSARNLIQMDWFSHSDPFVALFKQDPSTKRWLFVAQTEWIKDTHNPSFANKLHFFQPAGEDATLQFRVYDVDSDKVHDKDLMGQTELRASQLIAAGKLSEPLERRLRHPTNQKINDKLDRNGSTIVFDVHNHQVGAGDPGFHYAHARIYQEPNGVVGVHSILFHKAKTSPLAFWPTQNGQEEKIEAGQNGSLGAAKPADAEVQDIVKQALPHINEQAPGTQGVEVTPVSYAKMADASGNNYFVKIRYVPDDVAAARYRDTVKSKEAAERAAAEARAREEEERLNNERARQAHEAAVAAAKADAEAEAHAAAEMKAALEAEALAAKQAKELADAEEAARLAHERQEEADRAMAAAAAALAAAEESQRAAAAQHAEELRQAQQRAQQDAAARQREAELHAQRDHETQRRLQEAEAARQRAQREAAEAKRLAAEANAKAAAEEAERKRLLDIDEARKRAMLADEAARAKAAADAAAANPPTLLVEIQVSCRNLISMDWLSKSDPLVAVYQRDLQTGEYKLVDHTEWIKNDHDPDFMKRLVFAQQIGKPGADLRFKVMDVDGPRVTEKDVMGYCDISLATLAANTGKGLMKAIVSDDRKRNNKLAKARSQFLFKTNVRQVGAPPVARAVAPVAVAKAANQPKPPAARPPQLELSLGVRNLVKMDLLSKSDPIVGIYDKAPDGTWKFLGQTEWIKNEHDVDFGQPVYVVATGDPNKDFRFAVFDVDSENIRQEDLMGQADFKLAELLQVAKSGARIERKILHPDQAKKASLNEKLGKSNSRVLVSARLVKG